MSDPIDWAAFGMPEGVEVHRQRCADGWRFHLERRHGAPMWLNARTASSPAEAWVDFDGGTLTTSGLSTRILEAFLRAARAIEAGEVELNPEDSDDE